MDGITPWSFYMLLLSTEEKGHSRKQTGKTFLENLKGQISKSQEQGCKLSKSEVLGSNRHNNKMVRLN